MAVYRIVYELLEAGGMTHQQIADEVRRRIPTAQTSARSVASHAVAWRRARRGVRQTPAAAAASKSRPDPQPASTPTMGPATLAGIGEVISRAKVIASAYYKLTGRPLGITGEVGEYEAARLLGLALAPARAPGYDAVDGLGRRLLVKTRRVVEGANPGQRLGGIKLTHAWDAVLLVLLDEQLRPVAIWEADRPAVTEALLAPGSRARNERGALSVSKFKQIGRCVWTAVSDAPAG
jgi:hypothetical protein